jgi:hypothetical protein
MDDDDADYMAGSDDEVGTSIENHGTLVHLIPDSNRTTDLITPMAMRLMNQVAPMSRTCITPRNVS